jgi:hypothetical protein
MAEFEIIITQSGSLNLAVNTRIIYHEANVKTQNGMGVFYELNASQPSVVFIPHHFDSLNPEKTFERLLKISDSIINQGQTSLVPRMALARHTLMNVQVLVFSAPQESIVTSIRALQRNGQGIKAERLALSSIIPYISYLDALIQQGFIHYSNPVHFVNTLDAVGKPLPSLMNFDEWHNATPTSHLNALWHIGTLIHQLLLGHQLRLPLPIFDDMSWQTPQTVTLQEGTMSMGLRYILMALFHSPQEQRFTIQGAHQVNALGTVLREWYRLIHHLGGLLDGMGSHELSTLSTHLPEAYQFTVQSGIAQAIWEDLWWRIRSMDTLPQDLIRQHQYARQDGMVRARTDLDVSNEVMNSIHMMLNSGDMYNLGNYVNVTRERVLNQAQTKDATLWALWSHLGRWQHILDFDAPREVMQQIGLTLHRSPSEDAFPTLEIVENTLSRPNEQGVLSEVRLRRLACQQRYNSDWQSGITEIMRHLNQLPDYLQLNDFTLLPYTLLGQIIGTHNQVLHQAVTAIETGNHNLASALLEFAKILPTAPQDRQNAQRDLSQAEKLLQFLQNEQSSTSQMQFQQGADLLKSSLVSSNGSLREQVENELLKISDEAFQEITQALDTKLWQDVRNATTAHTLLSSPKVRHLLEQLRSSKNEMPRSIEASAALANYERTLGTYQQLFTLAKHSPLWNNKDIERSAAERQADAHDVLSALNSATELGIPMSEVIDDNESNRKQWQQMIESAMQTLKQVQHFSGEIDDLRKSVQGDEGVKAQIQAIADRINTLQTQIGLTGDTSDTSLQSQLKQLRQQLSDIEKTQQTHLESSKRELSTTQDEIKRQVEAHDIQLQRQAQQISSTSNLLQDTRERVGNLEHEHKQAMKHEADMLCRYLEAMPDAERFDRINSVLDAIDGLMHALRRCPVEAYDEGCHNTWMLKFNELRSRFETLANSKLGWRDRRNLKNNLRQIRALLQECEHEANQKYEGNKRTKNKPSGK